MRFYLEIIEHGHRMPTGNRHGYATLEEAEKAAMKHIDDALPNNWVRVYQHVSTAHMAGDGGAYVDREK